MQTRDLLVSIVTYKPNLTELKNTLQSLQSAAVRALKIKSLDSIFIILVSNDWDDTTPLELLLSETSNNNDKITAKIISGHGNVGFGAGHNIAARSWQGSYYLVLNPDVILDQAAIVNAISYLNDHFQVGLLSPTAVDVDGNQQFLCKRYPALADLILRGFMPLCCKNIFKKRLDRYEMRDICTGNNPATAITIISGCFMFFRGLIWNEIGGFNEKFFMYFEDFDLSLRVGKKCKLAYLPAVKIKHFGGHAAQKGIKHSLMFIKSALRFYKIHGLHLW